MNRRHFCKVAALAAGALGLGCPDAVGATVSPRPFRVRVLRCECYEDLQSLYMDDPETGRCGLFRPGQTFEIHNGVCPEGFCPHAFGTIMRYVAEGTRSCADAGTGRLIAACPDGTRPVIFKVDF